MLTQAQQKFIALKKNGIHVALFEGRWYGEKSKAGGVVFELGAKKTLNEAEAMSLSVCGFITYEGAENFNEIKKVHEFKEEPCKPIAEELNTSNVYRSNVSFEQYAEKIAEIKNLLLAGETYQVNYSIPFTSKANKSDPFELYRRLARINPSPYMCYIDTDDGALISNSPECLMYLYHDGKIETRPIKGSAQRGESQQKDAENEAALLTSEKNKAELAMIVDLERNDLGKVCTPASVRVRTGTNVPGDFRQIEKYSHIMHTVATVSGILEKEKTWRDALCALFPGGSVTGCPKTRTIEIIKKLEDGARGIYCGSAGFVIQPKATNKSASNNENTPISSFNILIRSLWYDKKSQAVTFRSGGGIVADSEAKEEYNELIQKAAAINSIL